MLPSPSLLESGPRCLVDLALRIPMILKDSLDYQAFARYLHNESLLFYFQLVGAYDVYIDDPFLLWNDVALPQLLLKAFAILFSAYSLLSSLHLLLTTKSRRERARQTEQEKKDRKRLILQKLLTAVTPTRSVWSDSYWMLAQNALKSQRLRIPVSALVEGLVTGEVELRDPERTLPDLIIGRLVLDGLEVQLESDRSLRTSVSATCLRMTAPCKVGALSLFF